VSLGCLDGPIGVPCRLSVSGGVVVERVRTPENIRKAGNGKRKRRGLAFLSTVEATTPLCKTGNAFAIDPHHCKSNIKWRNGRELETRDPPA